MKKNFILIYVLCFFLTGCTKYLDRNPAFNRKFSNKIYDLTINKESNFFEYKNKTYLKRDDEIILNTLFNIELPKQLVDFEISNMSEFSFYYPNKQCIFLLTDNERKSITYSDTLYLPSFKEIEVLKNQSTKGSFRDNFKENKYLAERNFYLYKRRNVIVLLFNIKDNNIEIFLNSIKSLKLE